MEIKWWNKTDLVCHYKDGQMTVNRDYEGRVSLSLEDLHNGNVYLTLRDIRRSLKGHYICEVTDEYRTVKEYIFPHIISVDFSLVVPHGTLSSHPGEGVILPVHLSPETNAVSMEIRWLKGTESIYHYKKGWDQVNDDYENRVSLFFQELERGNLSLILRNVQSSDLGDYTCTVCHDGCHKTGTVHLQVSGLTHRSKNSMEGIPPLNASSEVLQTERTSESLISTEETSQTQENPGVTMPNIQERRQESVFAEQERSSAIQPQVQEREGISQSITAPTPERPQDTAPRNPRRWPRTVKCQII
ncbi:butyrophilin subfamily 1 member A1-like isoform X2 [Onychostoma macrolepis]|uniref:butyrophilin subfamily 1 member A1-like isoform X2 n=1 Tax=Onychostoma macrolepis TaxID=369639 RepID=UPI00272CF033|nr:butyrophilin subfamily 1 member A1-like isoform X2 [Onychostoma macrolepis]